MPRVFRAQPQRSGERLRPGRQGLYPARWDRFAREYRRRNPFCVECLRQDRLTVHGTVVDHKWPVSDGGPMFPGEAGVMTLCLSHHGGWKRALEAHARETNQIHLIVTWCEDPASRPRLRGYS